MNRLPERASCQNGRENADALSLRRGDNAKIHTAVQGTGVSSAEKSRENEENPAFHEKSKKQVHRKQRKAREFSVQRKWALSKRMRRKALVSLSFSASWRAIVAYQPGNLWEKFWFARARTEKSREICVFRCQRACLFLTCTEKSAVIISFLRNEGFKRAARTRLDVPALEQAASGIVGAQSVHGTGNP